MPEQKWISHRVSDEIHGELTRHAERERRSVASLIKNIIEDKIIMSIEKHIRDPF